MTEPTGSTPPRRPTMLVVAVVALLTLGIGALVAIAGPAGPAGVALPDVAPFSLAAAAEGTVDARTVEFEVSVSTSEFGDVSLSGVVDNETEVARVTTNLSGLMGLGEASPIGGGDIEVLLDGDSGVMYVNADALGGLLPSDAPWLSVDLAALAEAKGAAPDDLQGELFVDPTELAKMLLDADNVVEIGPETIDGVDTVHSQVTVDVAAARAAFPQTGSQLDDAMIDVPDTVVYDVWVTADNQLRRAAFDTTVADTTVAVVLDMTTSDEPLDAELPAGSDVFDITGFLAW